MVWQNQGEHFTGKRGEGGVGFLVSEPLFDDVAIMKSLNVIKPFG